MKTYPTRSFQDLANYQQINADFGRQWTQESKQRMWRDSSEYHPPTLVQIRWPKIRLPTAWWSTHRKRLPGWCLANLSTSQTFPSAVVNKSKIFSCICNFGNCPFIFVSLFVKLSLKQDCIPVGCVPPACWPYLPACSALGGVCSGGVPALGDVPGLGGVPAPGGCTWSGGVSSPGGVCSWGVYLILGGCQVLPPREQNHRQL